jgi:ABC-type transport system substrate-binding protein
MGVTMTIIPLAVTEAIGQFNSGSRQALTLGYASQPDLAMSVANEFLGVRGLAGAAAPQLTSLIAEANGLAVDSKSRAAQLQDVGKAALELATLIPICSITSPWGVAKNITGVSQDMPNAMAVFNARYWSVKK